MGLHDADDGFLLVGPPELDSPLKAARLVALPLVLDEHLDGLMHLLMSFLVLMLRALHSGWPACLKYLVPDEQLSVLLGQLLEVPLQ